MARVLVLCELAPAYLRNCYRILFCTVLIALVSAPSLSFGANPCQNCQLLPALGTVSLRRIGLYRRDGMLEENCPE